MLRDKLLARLAEMGTAPDYPRLVSEVLGIERAPADLARRLIAQALVVEDRHETWRADGEAMLQRTRRSGADLVAHTESLWNFFRPRTDGAPTPPESVLGPLVFSWLAGRGADTTRVDPHDANSANELHARLARLLKDKDLFAV